MIWASLMALPVLFLVMPSTQQITIGLLAGFFNAVIWVLDCATGTHVLGLPPLVSWSIIGLVVGSALGFWSVAPALGMRSARKIAAFVPLALILALWVVDLGVSFVRIQEERKANPPVQNAPRVNRMPP